jgi:hypothetical protein
MRAKWMIVCLVAGLGVASAQAELTHRYAFNNNAGDAVGTLDGTMSAAGTNLEAPLFTGDVPGGAVLNFANQSIELGMTVGTKASWIYFGNGTETKIFDNKAGSFSYWFKADQVLEARDLVSNIAQLRTVTKSDGSISLYSPAGGGNFTFASPVTADTWHHLVVAWDDPNGQYTIALDGQIQTKAFTAGGLTDPARLMVGNFENSGNQLGSQFDGHIYDLQIYDHVLSATEVAKLHAYPGAAVGAEVASQTLPVLQHRYVFSNNVNDVVGTANGTESGDGTYIEPPQYVADTPSGATGPTKSLEAGMSVGTKKSGFKFVGTAVGLEQAGSYSLWLKADQALSGRYAMFFPVSGLRLIQQGANLTGAIGPDGSGTTKSFSTPFTVGGWTHVAMSWDIPSGTAAVYVNGANVWSSSTISNTIEMTSEARIMNYDAMWDNNVQLANQFDGHLYDLQFYTGQLDSDDVFDLYVNPGSAFAGELPTAVDNVATTLYNTAVTIDVLANDSGRGISIGSVSSPATNGVGASVGTVVNNGGTNVTYTPSGFSGDAYFTYVVSNVYGSDTGLVTVAVDSPFGTVISIK